MRRANVGRACEPHARRVVSFGVKLLRSIRSVRLCIALVLGVVTSVGVAWGFNGLTESSATWESQLWMEDETNGIVIFKRQDLGWRTITQFRAVRQDGSEKMEIGGGGTVIEREYSRAKKKPRELVTFVAGSDSLWIRSAGFPLICVEMGAYVGPEMPSTEYGFLRLHKDVRTLPASPLWGGLAVNTACYGAAWYPLLAVPGILRARLRRRKGKCGACGYDMRGLTAATCPECGER